MPLSQINSASLATGVPARTNMPVGSVLQVVSTTLPTTFTTSGSAFAAITGLTADITPTSTSNKVLVNISLGRVAINTAAGGTVGFRLMRGATPIGVGTTSGSQLATSFVVSFSTNNNYSSGGFNFQFLDSPASAASNTYSIQMYPESGAVAYINRSYTGGTGGTIYESASSSTITLMEIAA
jgi:hypothetical protein